MIASPNNSMIAAPNPDSVFETRDYQILRSDATGGGKAVHYRYDHIRDRIYNQGVTDNSGLPMIAGTCTMSVFKTWAARK